MQVRRVVTGSDTEGKAVFASDSFVDGITLGLVPGFEWHRLWGCDEPAEVPNDGALHGIGSHVPPSAGLRFGMFTVAPDSLGMPEDLDLVAAIEEMESQLPGLAALAEDEDPLMHTTDTVDFDYIVSGRVVLELDDGAAVELGPGDTIVMNGTRHKWRNPFDEPCLMVVVMVGAARHS
jgi:mannose-6-phosphate isomerase-like protein (cupin superfamily)